MKSWHDGSANLGMRVAPPKGVWGAAQSDRGVTEKDAPYREISSNAIFLVRGPISPIASITQIIAPAINTNTPGTPNSRNTLEIKNALKMAEKRLHE